MARRQKRNLGAWVLYAIGRAVTSVQLMLPWAVGRRLAAWMGYMGYLTDRPSRRKCALDGLMKSFPDWDEARAKATLRAVYRHMSESVLDGLHFVRLVLRGKAEGVLETVGFDKLESRPPGTGILFVTAHFGHWEVSGGAASLLGHPVSSVARPLRNPWMGRYIARLREATGQKQLPTRGGLRQMLRLLKKGENVAVLIDQDARRHGIFVDFFGRPASTTPAPASMAIRAGAAIAFVYTERIEGTNRFRMVLADLIYPNQVCDREEETLRITQRLTSDLEAVIRTAPEKWLWVHRRWKTYPGMYEGQDPGRYAPAAKPEDRP